MVTRVPIYLGGTGESTQAAAQAALGLHTSNSVAFTTVTIGAVNVLANDYATYLNAQSNDGATLLTARGNDYTTYLAALSNDYATYLNAQSNDGATLLTALGNDYTTLLSAYSNDVTTLATARGNDHATLLSAYSNDVTTLATARGNDHATLISATTNPVITGNVLINSNSANDALRINQIGSGNAFVVEDSANPDATPFVIDSSGKVGIGTTSPDFPLSVQSTGDTQFSLKNSSGTSKAYISTAGAFGSAGTDDLRIRSEAANIIFGFSGAETVRFTSSGSVGIGTGSPGRRLDVSTSTSYSSARFTSAITASPADLDAGEVVTISGTSGIAGLTFAAGDSRLLTFGVDPNNFTYLRAANLTLSPTLTLRFLTSGSERMRIDSSGNIGIGTSAPTATLDVVGTFSDAKANTVQQTLTDAATIAWDTSLGRVATVTLGASRTFGAPTNLKVGTYILHVIQGGTGSYTITWNGVFKWTAATAPTLSTAVGRRDIFSFISDGTNLYGAMIPDVR